MLSASRARAIPDLASAVSLATSAARTSTTAHTGIATDLLKVRATHGGSLIFGRGLIEIDVFVSAISGDVLSNGGATFEMRAASTSSIGSGTVVGSIAGITGPGHYRVEVDLAELETLGSNAAFVGLKSVFSGTSSVSYHSNLGTTRR